jgi:hypothetical protein
MRIENWPIGIVSFTIEAGDFVRAKSSAAVDHLQISPELSDPIGTASTWSSEPLESNWANEEQKENSPTAAG